MAASSSQPLSNGTKCSSRCDGTHPELQAESARALQAESTRAKREEQCEEWRRIRRDQPPDVQQKMNAGRYSIEFDYGTTEQRDGILQQFREGTHPLLQYAERMPAASETQSSLTAEAGSK